MDKKEIKKTSSGNKQNSYDDKEDLEIRSVAYFKGSSQLLLLMVLIILFGFTFFNSLYYIGKYYQNKDAQNKGVETVEINNNKYQVLITNDSTINGTLKDSNIKEEEDLVITKVNTIIMNTNDQNENDIELTFDIRYNILENDFPVRTHASNSSDLLTRFAYSYDNKNWTYINNAISTVNSTMTPLMGNYYDISGIVGNLRIATNYKLKAAPGEKKTMYWKSETVIKNKKELDEKHIKADFKIEYKENA